MDGIELQDREFIAAINEGREPNASVHQVLALLRGARPPRPTDPGLSVVRRDAHREGRALRPHRVSSTSRRSDSSSPASWPRASPRSPTLLAQRFSRAVHVRGDVFRKMIVRGRDPITPELGDEALRQLDLRQRIAANVANEYWRDDFTVVLQDIYAGDGLANVVGRLEISPLYVVVLDSSARGGGRTRSTTREVRLRRVGRGTVLSRPSKTRRRALASGSTRRR